MPRKIASKKPVAKKKPARKPKTAESSGKVFYDVVLKTRGSDLLITTTDDGLYPYAVGWNRLLNADRERMADSEWRKQAKKEVLELIASEGLNQAQAMSFLEKAAQEGVIQVEIPWIEEDVGYAARVFPWEPMLALATKDFRENKSGGIAVVRYLKRTASLPPNPATGQPVFAYSRQSIDSGYDMETEQRVIREAMLGTLERLNAADVGELKQTLAQTKPRVVHCVLDTPNKTEKRKSEALDYATGGHFATNEELADAVGAHQPELAVFSTCYSGRRVAPLAVVAGAHAAVGFHGVVMDASIPAFFAAFYQAWQREKSLLSAIQAGLLANGHQARPRDLGTVTLWADHDLLTVQKSISTRAKAKAIPAKQAASALDFICKPAKSINYCMLHNGRGGLFESLQLFKREPGAMSQMEITVRLNAGMVMQTECRFFAKMPEEGALPVSLIERVTLPLGANILRQRGETLRGALEVSVRCEDEQVFHHFGPMLLPPCDEWLDNKDGRRYLPCFIFPRDPGVREVITTAQLILRSLRDLHTAAFDGYQSDEAAVRCQVLSIWSALQHSIRLDYINPPPTYTKSGQRIRIPEEVLRSRRGTCIELALLLAACMEHIGVFPVIFLTPGHCFTGYWVSEEARSEFLNLGNLSKHAKQNFSEGNREGGGTSGMDESWVFKAPQHLALIREAVQKRRLIPLEATYIPFLQSFTQAVAEGTANLARLKGAEEFDGMLDIQSARETGVTPLAILTEGISA